MKTLKDFLSEYGESHQNPTNQKIHMICVPLIFFSIIGLGWTFKIWRFNISEYLFLIFLPFYFLLGRLPLWIYAFYFFGSSLIYRFLIPDYPILKISIGIFVVAWIGQFIGHRIEGKKPSFFQDLKFLLIGPLWVLLGKKKSKLNIT